MLSSTSMALTGELVSLSLRPELDPDPEQHRTPLTELEVEMFARRLLQESAGAPLWVFAYGSLIWKPDFDAVEWQRGSQGLASLLLPEDDTLAGKPGAAWPHDGA